MSENAGKGSTPQIRPPTESLQGWKRGRTSSPNPPIIQGRTTPKEKRTIMVAHEKNAVFTCSQCHRRYSTQSALLRHQKSHDRSAWHSCEICHLKFSRTDILQRHKQLHGNGNGPSERKRAIKACDGCRRNKIRCTGDNPCQTCSRVGKKCTYLTHMARPSVQGLHKERKQVLASSREEHPKQPEYDAFAPTDLISTADPVPSGKNDSRATLLTLFRYEIDTQVASFGANGNHNRYNEFVTSDLVAAVMTDNYNTALLAENPQFFTNIDRLLAHSPNLAAVTSKGNRNFDFLLARSPDADIGGSPSFFEFSLGDGFDHSIFPATQTPYLLNDNLPDPIIQNVFLSHNVVRDMVHQAAVDFLELGIKDAVFRSRKRRNFSQVIEEYFNLSSYMKDKTTHVLHTFLSSFFENFSVLWPITWHQGADHDTVEPLLYLTMTAIGAMHTDSPNAAAYGLALHQELCAVLPNACLLCPDEEIKLEIIFEALLLSETMALYRGDSEACGFVQQARTVLLSHARRLGLFHELPAQESSDWAMEVCHNQTEKKLQQWIRMERRRRMAFGFFRCEVFSGLLFNTSPLIGSEDLCLRIPCDHETWMYVGPEWREKLLLVAEEAISYPLYSDLMRAATECENTQLPPLNASAHELVLYGLQIPLLASLHSSGNLYQDMSDFGSTDVTDPSILFSGFQTSRFASGIALPKILSLIDRWRATHDRLQSANRPDGKTPSGGSLSPQLLYHMGYIRSNADLMALQSVASYNSNKEESSISMGDFSQDQLVLQQVRLWVTTNSAKVALSHACQIWALAEKHLARSESKHASSLKYDQDINIVSMISLYYAAIVIWVMAELCPDMSIRNIRQGVRQIGDVVARASALSWQTASSLITNTRALAYKGLYYS
ncbi:hypothetical protein PISL3812_03631 [Talaromyces islandicus]|uniref:Uncharacterized protein n=1 Tax=Talaromyces islandicus TaxID=28573 RepID=A0A0U1LVD4_TALIS|nr:hypothetical protein PISL3812_03631 [Talaromyces islandicus]